MEAKRSNPYIGPQFFTRGDSDLFFGRDSEGRDLAALVASERMVLFYASSGAGKTSLINTRLIPRLEDFGFVVLPVSRVGGELPLGVAEVTNIFAFNLMLSIVNNVANPNRLANLSLVQFLARLISEDGLTYSYNERLDITDSVEGYEAVRHVLIIDQFEEIFTTHLDRWSERADFFRQVEHALISDPHLWVVLSLREDYLAPLESYAPLLSNKMQAHFYMQRLNRAAALAAVIKPAAEFNRPFAQGAAETLVDNLRQIKRHHLTPAPQNGNNADAAPTYDDQITATVLGQFVEPVQLQVVCYKLWKNLKNRSGDQITDEDLGRYGDVDSALADFYEDALVKALQQTDWPEIELRRWFEKQLITKAGTRGIVYQGPEQTADLPNPVIKVLADQFLLRTEPRAGAIWVELIHDRFIGPIQQANQRYERIRLQSHPLMQTLQIWQDSGRSDEQLLTDAQLHKAEEYYVANRKDVTPEELQFLKESQRYQQERAVANQAAIQRRRRIIIGVLLIISVLLGLTIWAWSQTNRATNAKAAAEDQARIALSRQLAAQALNRVTSNPDLGLLLSLESGRHDPEMFDFKSSLFSSLVSPPFLDIIMLVPGRPTVVDFNHDGRILATGGRDQKIYLLDVARHQIKGQPLTGHNDVITDIAFSPNGEYLVSSADDGYVIFWDIASSIPLGSPQKTHKSKAKSLAFSPDGQILVSSGADGEIIFWDVSSQQAHGTPIVGHDGVVRKTTFSPDGQILASVGEDSQTILWDVKTHQRIEVLTGHEGPVYSVAFSPNGQLLATGGWDTKIQLWDVSTCCSPLGNPMEGHSGTVFEVAFSLDGKHLVSVSEDRSIILWDVATGKPLNPPLFAHGGNVTSMSLSPDGKRFATAAADGKVIFWSLPNRYSIGFPVLENYIPTTSVAFSPRGNILAVGNDSNVVLLDSNWQIINTFGFSDGESIRSIAFSPDSNFLAFGGANSKLSIWDLPSNKPLLQLLKGHSAAITSVAYSPDGKLLATASEDDTVLLWDLETHRPIVPPLNGHTDDVSTVTFSPDGKLLASGGVDRKIIVWDVLSHKPVGSSVIERESSVNDVTFSPDGKVLASGENQGRIFLWDVDSWQNVGQLVGHNRAVEDVDFSPDGKTLASASADQTVILWDIGNQEPLGPPLVGHQGFGWTVDFSPDGQKLVSGGRDGTVMLWNLDLKLWQSIACRRANRNMSMAEWIRFIGADVPYQPTCPQFPLGEGAEKDNAVAE